MEEKWIQRALIALLCVGRTIRKNLGYIHPRLKPFEHLEAIGDWGSAAIARSQY
jgi:hypothetical protein